jgi:hypothetical protein
LNRMNAIQLARQIAARYAELTPVQAVVLSGSRTSQQADENSDIDLYVYVTHPLTLGERASIAAGAKQAEIGNSFWEAGDEWVDASGNRCDVMFREMDWIDEQINRVLIDHQASIGYTTCFWYNVRNSTILFDREAWFARLQERASAKYPAELTRNIVAKNHPLLRTNMSSYSHQIALAQKRGDVVSVNHRVTALMASYFDILFAVNNQLHPGEKRLVRFAEQMCAIRPPKMREQVERAIADPSAASLDELLDGLDDVLRLENLLPLAKF